MNQTAGLPLRPGAEWWMSTGLPLALIVLTTAVTAWVVFSLHPMERAIFSDMRGYVSIAADIANGRFDLGHFHQPIAFPLWVALWRTLAEGDWWLLKLTHVLLVPGSVFLGWQVAKLVLPRPWDLLVLALLSFQLQWWALAGFALPETLYTFLLTALLLSATRWVTYGRLSDAALAGLLFGASFYVKGSAVYFPALVLIWFILRLIRRDERRPPPFRHLLIAAGIALSIALAHGTFALMNYGIFKLSGDSGALNLVEGKCRHKKNIDSRGSSWLSPLFNYLGETEIRRWDEPFTNQPYFWRQGLKCIKDNPAVLLTSVRYIYYLFGDNPLWPVQQWRIKPAEALYEQFFLFVLTPFAVIGFVQALRHPHRPEIMAALLIASLLVLVYVFKSELRYRVPFDAATITLAVLGARATVHHIARLRRPRAATDPSEPTTPSKRPPATATACSSPPG